MTALDQQVEDAKLGQIKEAALAIVGALSHRIFSDEGKIRLAKDKAGKIAKLIEDL